MKAKTWVVIILLSLCAVLLVQNMEVVSLKIFFWQISMSRIIAFPVLVLLGIAIGYFLGRHSSVGVREKRR